MADLHVDLLIVGGGGIGASLMLALEDLGYRTLLVDAQKLSNQVEPDFDARSLALSPASIRILEMLKVWPLLQEVATAIHTVHVSEQGVFGSTRIKSDGESPLGYVVEMQHIRRALYERLDSHNIMAPSQLVAFDPIQKTATINTFSGQVTVATKLLIAADGADSSIRQWCGLTAQIKPYEQHAIVANIGLARSHHGMAYERFIHTGPLAFLPISDKRSSLVWVLQSSMVDHFMALDDVSFLKALQETFGYRLGRLMKVGKRVVYPLRQVIMPQQVAGSVVFVGNAAHTLHPIAGQGFNLSLRDIAILAECIAKQGLNDDMLRAYQSMRRHDQVSITCFTDGLIELFSSSLPGLSSLRGAGLVAVDNLPVLKHILSRYARGFAGVSADLVCGIPLYREDL